MAISERPWDAEKDANLLAFRLADHLCCITEDATDPGVPSIEPLALVWNRAARIREIRAELKATHVRTV